MNEQTIIVSLLAIVGMAISIPIFLLLLIKYVFWLTKVIKP